MYIDNLSGSNPYSTLSSSFAQTVATLALLDSPTSSSTSSSSTTATSTTTTTASSTTTASTPGSPITIKVRAVNLLGVQFTGMCVTLKSASGTILAHGYTTLNFNKGVSGTTYTVCVDNYQTKVFSHLGDGTTISCEIVKPTSNLVLTAYYG